MEHSDSFPGVVLTWSCSPRIAVWNYKESLTKPYVSTYQVSNSEVILCRITNTGPYCISTYSDHNIRIWNIRSMQTVQTIQLPVLSAMTFLHMMKNDSFIVGAKEVYLFNNLLKDTGGPSSFVPPALFLATFNAYHKRIICVSR
jgi:WD40 repeat protein